MTFVDIIPIEQHSMSIYTFLCGSVLTACIAYLYRKSESHNIRIIDLEIDTTETNTIVKRIDKNMDTVLANAQELNSEVVKHLLKEVDK